MQTVRAGLLAQEEVRKLLKEHFVCWEFDATEGVPEGIPGLGVSYKAWQENPWTRVSFGTSFVMDAKAEVTLTAGYCPHNRKPGDAARQFQEKFERGLKRYKAIREHEPGSEAEQQAIDRIIAEVAQDNKTQLSCIHDVDLHTAHSLNRLGQGKVEILEKRLGGTFVYPDPVVRRQAAESVGRYAASNAEDFSMSNVKPYLAEQLTTLLSDDDASVQFAAAVALYQFAGETAPTDDQAELIASAQSKWNATP